MATSRLAAIAKDYIQRFREPARGEMRHYQMQPSLRDAIREATLSRVCDGSRHPHQYRIPGQVLGAAENIVQREAKRLRKSTSFGDLHGSIEKAIGSIRGIGPLAIYDIAHRIGAFLRLEPELVYLHAGTRDGARSLGLHGDALELAQVPIELRCLSAAELEDCLCIYKRELRSIRAESRSTLLESCGIRRRRKSIIAC